MSEMKQELLPCPCCGTPMFTMHGSYEICDVCEWEDDSIQSEDPDFKGGANSLSLNQARKEWIKKQSAE